MELHQLSLETFFRNSGGGNSLNDEDGPGNASGGGPESPRGSRVISDSGTAGADGGRGGGGRGGSRSRSHSNSQRSPFLETPAWLQRGRTATSGAGGRW
ncbi:unnamed protein product, partial [Scytosiphon promiscuus]